MSTTITIHRERAAVAALLETLPVEITHGEHTVIARQRHPLSTGEQVLWDCAESMRSGLLCDAAQYLDDAYKAALVGAIADHLGVHL